MKSFLADFFDRSGSRIRTEVLVHNGENFAQKFGELLPQLLSEIFPVIYQYYCTNSSSATGNKVALAELGDPPGSSACNPLFVPGKRPQPNGSLPI